MRGSHALEHLARHPDCTVNDERQEDAVAVLVELAFIDHAGDAELLRSRQDEFARAIARGVTDYEGEC